MKYQYRDKVLVECMMGGEKKRFWNIITGVAGNGSYNTDWYEEGDEEHSGNGYYNLEQEGKYKIIKVIKFINNNKKEETFMSKISKFVKNMVLSADERLLRKHGFKNECGEYTDDAQDFAVQKLCEENEAKMVEVAKALDKEKKAKEAVEEEDEE